ELTLCATRGVELDGQCHELEEHGDREQGDREVDEASHAEDETPEQKERPDSVCESSRREECAPEAKVRVRLRVLDRMTDLVGADGGGCDRTVPIDVGREVNGAVPRVVVIRERTLDLLDRYVVESVRIEDSARNLGAGEAVGNRYLEV